MKIACEKCNKIIDNYFKEKYVKIRMGDEEIILCKECYKKLIDWMYEKKEEE